MVCGATAVHRFKSCLLVWPGMGVNTHRTGVGRAPNGTRDESTPSLRKSRQDKTQRAYIILYSHSTVGICFYCYYCNSGSTLALSNLRSVGLACLWVDIGGLCTI